jgi:hypothetical protein
MIQQNLPAHERPGEGGPVDPLLGAHLAVIAKPVAEELPIASLAFFPDERGEFMVGNIGKSNTINSIKDTHYACKSIRSPSTAQMLVEFKSG